MMSWNDPRAELGRSDGYRDASWDSALGPSRWWVIAAVAVYAAVFAARQMSDDPVFAFGVLYALPVAILALRFGLRGGLAGFVVASALLLVDSGDVPLPGVLTRLSANLLVAIGLGLTVDRVRGLADELRAAVEERDRNYWHFRRVADVLPIFMDCGDVREGPAWTEVADYMRRNAGFVSHGLARSARSGEPRSSMHGKPSAPQSDRPATRAGRSGGEVAA